jgi:hypothetical protein
LALLVAIGSSAAAQDRKPEGQPTRRPAQTQPGRPAPADFLQTLRRLDLNGDQAVSLGEVPEGGHAAFQTLLKHGDADSDGQLSVEEFRALGTRLRAVPPSRPFSSPPASALLRRFRQADRDGDGRLSPAEFPGRPEGFSRLDRDADGFLSPGELRPMTPPLLLP